MYFVFLFILSRAGVCILQKTVSTLIRKKDVRLACLCFWGNSLTRMSFFLFLQKKKQMHLPANRSGNKKMVLVQIGHVSSSSTKPVERDPPFVDVELTDMAAPPVDPPKTFSSIHEKYGCYRNKQFPFCMLSVQHGLNNCFDKLLFAKIGFCTIGCTPTWEVLETGGNAYVGCCTTLEWVGYDRLMCKSCCFASPGEYLKIERS